MTKRGRAAAAAKWRRIARGYERNLRPGGYGYGDSKHVTCAGLCSAATRTQAPSCPIDLFSNGLFHFWPLDRDGDDCRVIAAGLIAAMYATGEFDQ